MLSCDKERLQEKILTFSKFGDTGRGGITRLSLSEPALQARAEFCKRMKALGADIVTDDMANVYATIKGSEDLPRIASGSHCDSVVQGGNYDGILGVMTAMEVAETIVTEKIPHRHPITVMIWTNEEGARFDPAMMSSGVITGKFDKAKMLVSKDKEGMTFGEALDASGYKGDEKSRMNPKDYMAFVELHIEQGPVLESMNLPLGAVTGTKGVERHLITFHGQEAHSGSTPMNARRDALAAAAKLALEIRPIAKKHPDAVCTMGSVKTFPGIVTAVVGRCEATLDQRDLDAGVLAEMYREAQEKSRQFAQEENCTVEWSRIWNIAPEPFHPRLIDFCEEAIRDTVGRAHRLPSGPLHDAAEVSRAGVPTTMMFVQSLKGISHNKIEDTREEHLEQAVTAFDRLAQKTMEWIAVS